ncbi:hypothetical protein EVAR_91468_1 [Eumeta japonica]|uniref:Uncharacterized protein n=1 Tax=Eumeta variegata TaxID=151549 RepID=A0A4C1WZ60_EUMVA|nr:hypothetical protein EVAR_91468_1 [Eumeta japonica]
MEYKRLKITYFLSIHIPHSVCLLAGQDLRGAAEAIQFAPVNKHKGKLQMPFRTGIMDARKNGRQSRPRPQDRRPGRPISPDGVAAPRFDASISFEPIEILLKNISLSVMRSNVDGDRCYVRAITPSLLRPEAKFLRQRCRRTASRALIRPATGRPAARGQLLDPRIAHT